MEHDHIPQCPPPPYSESDTGTLSGIIPQARNPLASPTSSVDEIIYTPSYSPTASVHQSQTLGDDFDLVSSASASAYFESRPPRTLAYGAPEIHRITITTITAPKDLPYPQAFLAKDCTAQDWATFVNYLLPDHAAQTNIDVVDRKLQAEIVESMHQLGLGESEQSQSNGSEINAHLLHLRQQIPSNTSEKSRTVESTISEWNDFFFRPRGILISNVDQDAEIVAGERTGRSSYPYIPPEEETRPESSRDNHRFLGLGGFPFIDAGRQGFRMGPIVANSEGFRIGKSLVANNEGFRLGNVLVSDQHGFRLGGSRGFVKDPNGASLGGRPIGRRESAGVRQRGWGHHGHHRGRSFSHGEHRRDRSLSASSSSSSSSSDSDSSVGSLPEHDDLSDQQLPVMKQSLMDWLNHPEQPISKEFVRNVRRDIKAAKRQPPSPQLSDQDLKRMRSEVKDLLKSLKENRKARKKQKKAARRARRLEKKDRRASRREVRRGKMPERHCDGGGRGPPWMAVPHSFMPNQPPPPTPANTNLPPAPPMPTPAAPGFILGRTTSVPSVQSPSYGFGFGRPGRPGMQAMHGGWPFTQALPYAPGRIRVPNEMTYPGPISRSAEKIHTQALQMEQAARSKDSRAMELRTAATGRGISEKQRLKYLDLATKLEEEAEDFRIEAERLGAETQHLDTELARELEEDGGQTSGIVQN